MMLLRSNAIDETDTDDELKPYTRSSIIIKNILFIGICCILLLIMIITLSIMANLPLESLLLIIISIIAIILLIVRRSIKFWITIKKNHGRTVELKHKNNLKRIVYITSICLTLFTIIFTASIMIPIDYSYGRFGTFILYLINMSTLIWILTFLLYLSIISTKLLWKKSFYIRQQLSAGLISFFLATFLMCSLFIFTSSIPTDSALIGLGLGIALSTSYILFVGGFIGIILYQSKIIKSICSLLSLIGCTGFILILWFYLNDGYNKKIDVIIPSERFPINLTHDPSSDGNYSYSFLTYGSGFDYRIDYEKKASIITPTIDLSSLIKISSFNRQVLKYNETSLPLNGRIWYPTNNLGPYPLVLMVHGNHLSTESSEIGYDYLGKMLASQGFICVSIDENYLNSAPLVPSTEFGKISKIKQFIFSSNYGPEYIARGLIILETLKQIRLWNENSTNKFYQKIDLSNIGLMGHSRGGEAIVIAYLLNKLQFLPEYPSQILFNNYNFQIKTLFSIAGTADGYMPLGHSVQFSDVTLFAIHGIYDGDVVQFLFQSKITNLKFTSNSSSYHFKASLYVHQANHGQFNTNWGKYDLIPGTNQFMNIRPLLKIEEQQHISKIYMSALMNFVLKNQTEYRSLFEDYRSIINYLPSTNYISTFQDSNEIIIANFENYDVTKGTIGDSYINTTNLLLWSSVYLKTYRSVMLLLQPMDNLTGIYTIHLQNPINGSNLRFMIGRTPDGLIDYLTVRIFYENETYDSFNVRVLPALAKQIYKITPEEYVTAVQTISLPLLHSIIGLEFIVNGTNAQFLIDNIVIVNDLV